MREKLEVGKICPFQITLFEPKERKMTLVYLGDEEKAAKSEEKTQKTETAEEKK